jgi:hypothetical protein
MKILNGQKIEEFLADNEVACMPNATIIQFKLQWKGAYSQKD